MNPATQNRISRMAFTLIELLAVIAIIGLLAGMVMGLSGVATRKSRAARLESEKERLVVSIENYKADLGNFPPDNRDYSLSNWVRAGKSPLFYELSGARFTNISGVNNFIPQTAEIPITAPVLKSGLGVDGIENSARLKKDIPWKGISFKPSQYAELADHTGALVLITPLKGPRDGAFPRRVPTGSPTGTVSGNVNPWFYDASSTNRHNEDSYDLWTEYLDSGGTKVIGNWKD